MRISYARVSALVIIGLIMGGVLVGRDLIEVAKWPDRPLSQ